MAVEKKEIDKNIKPLRIAYQTRLNELKEDTHARRLNYDNFIETFKDNLTARYIELYNNNDAKVIFIENDEDHEMASLPTQLFLDFWSPTTYCFNQTAQMSSSERIIAAIAMLFTIISYRQSPIVILDESQFDLNKEMSEKMTNFFIRQSISTQIFTVTDNLSVYKKAETIIGITMDVSFFFINYNRFLSFNLDIYYCRKIKIQKLFV